MKNTDTLDPVPRDADLIGLLCGLALGLFKTAATVENPF